MKLMLVGLPSSLETAIREAADRLEVGSTGISSVRDVRAAVKLFKETVLVVIPDGAWNEWKKVRSAAPPVYVALAKDELVLDNVEGNFASGVAGYGPANLPDLAVDIVRCWQTLRRSDPSDAKNEL